MLASPSRQTTGLVAALHHGAATRARSPTMQMTNRLARPALLTLPSLAGGAGGSAGCSARQLVSSQSTPGFAVNPELGAPGQGLPQHGAQHFASQPPPVAHEPAAQPLQPHNFDSRGSSQGTSGTGTSTALNQSLPTTSTQAQGTQAQDTVMSKLPSALPCATTSSVQSGSAKSSSVAPSPASSLAVPQLSVPPPRGSVHVQGGPGDASQIPTQRGALQPPTPPNPDGPQLAQRWGSAHISAGSPKHNRSSPSPTRKQQQGWTPAQPWAHLQTQTQPWPQPGARGSRPANLQQQQQRSKDLQAQTPPPSQTPRIVDRTPPSQSLVCPAEDLDSPRLWTKNDEYCRERKPTDPFYYPTTMSPLTGIGLNAIEQSTLTMKASPKKTDGQPGERPSESPREGLDCQTLIDEDTHELRILQEQSDALSRHVQALEQAKSLAAVQSAQALRKIQSRQEAIRREAQAMLSSKELPAEFAISPELIGAPRPCGLPPPTILAGRRSASASSLTDPEMHPEKAVIAVGGPPLVPAIVRSSLGSVTCGAFAGIVEDAQETFRSAASVEAPAWRQDSRRDEGRSPESHDDVPQSSPVMLPQLPQTPQSWATPFQKTSGRAHTPTKTHRYVDALGNPLGSSDRVFVNIKDEPSPTPDASPSGVEVCTAFSVRGRAQISHSPFVDALGNPLGPTSERSFPDIKDEHPEEVRMTSGVEVPPSLATTSGRSSRSQLHHPEVPVDVESRTSSEALIAREPTPGPSAQERPAAHERAQPLPAHERSPNSSRASTGQGSARLRSGPPENSGIGATDGGAACSPTSHPARGETQIPQCAATRRRPPSPPPRSGRARDEQEHWEHDPPSNTTPQHKRPSSPPASRRDGSIGTARGRRQDENHNRERSVRDRSPRKSMESFLQQEEVVDPPHSEQQQVELEECLDTIRWCAESVTRDSLQDLRNMTKPPAVVRDVVEAVVLLLGQSETRWEKLKRILSSPSFLERIQRLNIQQGVTREQFQRLRERLQHPEFDEELIKTTCVPAVPLATWCRAIGVYLSKTKYRGGPGVRPVAAAVATHHHSERRAERASTPTARAPTPTASEYITFDPDIRLMSPEELLAVKELTICRPDVGTVTFHGNTDCSNLDLEHVVRLEVGEVLVYPEPDLKPPIGSGLNKPATVTLYQCWPPNGSALLQDVRSQEKYRTKIKQMTEDKHARFVDYDCNTGVWKFSVDHF